MVAVLEPANADGAREADDERDEQDRDRGAAAASHGSITAAVAAGRRFAESASYTPRMAANRALRELPSVDMLLRDPRFAAEPRALALAAVRRALERAREEIRAGHDPGDLVERALSELRAARAPSLKRVLNATGVILHTNLGRAPLAASALARVAEVGASYSNLELDLGSGSRGSRQDHLAGLIRRLTGAEAALVVNNNAAAVLLALAA